MGKRAAIIPVLIGFVFAVVYAVFPTAMLTADGLYYAWHIENMPISYSIHPHHLLWLGLMHLLFNAIHLVIPGLSALEFMQFFNASIGGACVCLVIYITMKLHCNLTVAIITGLFFGLSWGMMHFSTDANIYITVLFLILLCSDILFSSTVIDIKKTIAVVIVMILATLLHQVAILFVPALLAAMWLKSPIKTRLSTIAASLLTYTTIVFLVYFAAFQYVAKSAMPDSSVDFISWLGAYGSHSEYWTFLSQGMMPAQEAFQRSQASLFFHFHNALDVYLAQEYSETKIHSVLYFLLNLVIVISIIREIKDIIINRKMPKDIRNVSIVLLSWFLPFFIFNYLYCPHEIHFKLFYLAPLLILWTSQIISISGFNRTFWRIAAPCILVIIAAWNVFTGLVPNSSFENNPYYHDVELLKPHLQKGDLVIYARQERNKASLVRYFTDADAVFFRPKPRHIQDNMLFFFEMHDFTREFLKERYSRILVSSDAWDSQYPKWFLPEHLFVPPHPDELGISKFRFILVRQIDVGDGVVLFEVKFPL